MSSTTFYFTVLRQGLSLNQKLALLARLAGKLANELLGSTCLLYLNVGDDLHAVSLFIMQVLGI